MNSEAGDDSTHPAIAYIGRVPVKVAGPISKGDGILPGDNGIAVRANNGIGFGWALETNLADTEKLVLCIIK